MKIPNRTADHWRIRVVITWINNQHVFLAVSVEGTDEPAHLFLGEVDGIEREILVAIHVVNVSPHNFKWDAGFCVSRDHTFEVSNVLVAVTALMETYAEECVLIPEHF